MSLDLERETHIYDRGEIHGPLGHLDVAKPLKWSTCHF